jgi:phosphoenolpyruvate carboxykinase (ATP)
MPSHGLADQGIITPAAIQWNLQTPELVEEAIRRGEGLLAKDGPLVVRTGKHTGRSARDKFIVRDAETEGTIWWDNNASMSSDQFAVLKADFLKALGEKENLYVADLYGGSQPEHRVRVRVINELAWHNLFIRTLLVRPAADDLPGFAPEFTIIDLPTFRATPERHGTRSETVIAVNLTEKLILIGGTAYAGEMKKSVFGILNYLLPVEGVMPMHCSANIGAKGDTAVFFGLSGTGKTTLSADASRTLIGDDEHGWSDTAVFNFEGGCYAKMIRLSPEAEPEIFATTKRFGTVLENVVIDPDTRELDFDDATYAENTRGAYPIEFIANCSRENMGPVPKNIVFLTADAFGVLPPRSPAPRSASPSRRRPSRPASAPRSCRATRPSTAICSRSGSPGGASPAGWSIPAGPAANMASASACRSRRRGPCSTPRSTAASMAPNSAPTRISASRFRSQCPASTARSSTRATHGSTRRITTRPRRSWSSSSSTISPSSKLMSTKA